MKRSSLKSFIDLQTSLIVDAGGVPSNGVYTYVLHTRGGALRLKPMGDWVACRSNDIELAKSAGVPFNSLNGKCNFHDTTTTDGSIAFEEFIATVGMLK